MKRRRFAGVCTLGLVLLGALPGAAAPSVWQRAREPKAQRAARLLRSLGRTLDDAREAADDAETLQNFRLAAIAMAELSGAPALEDPALLLLYGDLLLDAKIAREAEARALAEKLLDQTGPRDLWLEAGARGLAARAARGSPVQAIPVITRALALTWDAHARSVLFRQRADARMALGDLPKSLSDQRAALAAAEHATDRALARYALGLTLERSLDLPGALAELRLADAAEARLESAELSLLEAEDAFVFRPFDRYYALALTAMGLAEHARDRESALLEYERALAEWDRFEIGAPPDDPWLANARLHRRAVELERERRQRPAE